MPFVNFRAGSGLGIRGAPVSSWAPVRLPPPGMSAPAVATVESDPARADTCQQTHDRRVPRSTNTEEIGTAEHEPTEIMAPTQARRRHLLARAAGTKAEGPQQVADGLSNSSEELPDARG